MSAFGGYRVKDRSAKVKKRREAMPVNGRGVFVLQAVIQAKADEARRNLETMKAAKTKRGAP